MARLGYITRGAVMFAFFGPEIMNFAGYHMVTSGLSCNWITTKEHCLEAARTLGLSDTIVHSGSWSHRPPGCWMHEGYGLHFNTNTGSTSNCGYSDDTATKPNCICKDTG